MAEKNFSKKHKIGLDIGLYIWYTVQQKAENTGQPGRATTERTETKMKKFEIGKTYQSGGRLITIVKRTLRTVTYRYETRSGDVKTHRGGIHLTFGNDEYFCDSLDGRPVYAFSNVKG